jgi:predicted esterase
MGRVTAGEHHLAHILAPQVIDPARHHPLVLVLHGAGRQDEMLARMLREEADRRQAVFVVPRSRAMTWDLIAGGAGEDLAFIKVVLESVYGRFPIDPRRQAVIGFSDGASYALALGLSNPRVFDAVMGWAAGFVAIDTNNFAADDPKPRVLLEHGTRDQLFPFEQVAVPIRDLLTRLGYPLEYWVDEGGIHWPRADLMPAMLDWYLGPAAAG